MNLDPPFGTEAPINWHDLPQNQGQPAPQEQSSGPKVGWSQVLFVADSQHSHRQNHDAKTTSFLSRSHFDVNSNMPAFDTGNHALGDYNAPSNPYHNPFQNPPTNSVCAPSLGPSTTWPLDLNATRFHAALSQHDEAFQVGTMFQFSNFPHHGLYHATETAAPSCVSLPSQAHPVDGFGQYRVRRPSEARHQAHLNYGTLSRTGHAAPRPPTPRPIIPKPMPRSELTTPKKGKQQKAQITQIAASYSKSICPGNGWMEGEAHRAASLKRKRSLSPYNKRARVPKKLEHYYNCYQANIPPLPNPETDTRRRTRSAKVCFRCQDQKLKCDGSFPCKKCLEVARRGRVTYELPCIEADLHALNPFFDLLEHKWKRIPLDSLSGIYRFMHVQQFIMIQDHSTSPQVTSHIIAGEANKLLSLIFPIPVTATRRIISDFSYLTSTGLPASVERFCHPHSSRSLKVAPYDRTEHRNVPEHSFFHACPELEAAYTLLIIIFHGEMFLARRLSLPPHEMHALRFYWMAKTLGLSADIWKRWKARPNDVKADQKVRLGLMLIALLIVTECRETYIVESLRRKFEGHCEGSSEMAGGHPTSIVGYICHGMTTMKHLRQCLRHLLRRLFGRGDVPREFWEAAVSIGYVSGNQPKFATLGSTIYNDMDGPKIRQGLSKRLNTYLRNSMPSPIPLEYGVTRDEFEKRVDYLGSEDVQIGPLHMRERRLDDSLVASQGLLLRRLSHDQLKGYADGLVKKRDPTFKRAASDEFQISGDKTADTVLKYLFLKWLEA